MPIDPRDINRRYSVSEAAKLLDCDVAYMQRAHDDGELLLTWTCDGDVIEPWDFSAFILRRRIAVVSKKSTTRQEVLEEFDAFRQKDVHHIGLRKRLQDKGCSLDSITAVISEMIIEGVFVLDDGTGALRRA